ncbi:hypothetical protein [Alteribacter populi]|uniref:hypothetical protein n=1 Tax=Alteribacter populi TaxID=2011011 RepID=UPI000BBB4C0D|nr:hypothetical protein [Alteribacter populi]
MSFKEKFIHYEWVQPFLPNYMKPLQEPRIEEDSTSLMVHETEEFLSDLASLSELPRMNKTFKRKIKGFMLKVKIKHKKLHLEMLDSKRSSASIRKRIYITIYRKNIKAEKGLGKCIDATIYFNVDGRNMVRNIKHHPLFRPVFLHLHMLDSSLSGSGQSHPTQSSLSYEEPNEHEMNVSTLQEADKNELHTEIKKLDQRYQKMNQNIYAAFTLMKKSITRCIEDFDLLDIEERHQVKRIIVKEIPDLLGTYQTLPPQQKEETEHEIILAIEKMDRFLKKITSSLDSNRMERMNHLLRVNKLRYEDKE